MATARSRLARLTNAARELVHAEHAHLLNRFGTGTQAQEHWWYHNADHGLDVALENARLTGTLAARGEVPQEHVPLALIAGIFHDHIQTAGPERNEQLSVQAAMRAMRRYNDAHGGDVFTKADYAFVAKQIRATRVSGIHGGDIKQKASPEDLAEATIADADLSGLGLRRGFHQALLLFAEQQGTTDPAQTLQDPNLREKLLGFLRFQVGLFSAHAYLLPESSERYAYQRDNSGEAQRVHDAVVDGSIDWPQELENARRRGGPRPGLADADQAAAPSRSPSTGPRLTAPAPSGAPAGGSSTSVPSVRAQIAAAVATLNEVLAALAASSDGFEEAHTYLMGIVEASEHEDASAAISTLQQVIDTFPEVKEKVRLAIEKAEDYSRGL